MWCVPTQNPSKQRRNSARSLLAKCPVALAPPSLDFESAIQNLVVNLWKQLDDIMVEAERFCIRYRDYPREATAPSMGRSARDGKRQPSASDRA